MLDEIKRILRDLDYSTNSHFVLLIGRPEKNPALPDESAELFTSRTIKQRHEFSDLADQWLDDFRSDIAEPRREQHVELLRQARAEEKAEEEEVAREAKRREERRANAAFQRLVNAHAKKKVSKASDGTDTDSTARGRTSTRDKGKGKATSSPPRTLSPVSPLSSLTESIVSSSSRATSPIAPVAPVRVKSEVIDLASSSDSEDEEMGAIQAAITNSHTTFNSEQYRGRPIPSSSRVTLDGPAVPAAVIPPRALHLQRALDQALRPPNATSPPAAVIPHAGVVHTSAVVTDRDTPRLQSNMPDDICDLLRALDIPPARWLRFEYVWRTTDPREYEAAVQSLNERFNLGLHEDLVFDIVILFSRHPPPPRA
ncbi:hypothetical protein EXIGLDRAFT_754450 [Exidia glandulosa HHB12029]|uniref:Uncharacterized protein n=1 Tax=Exidia glandulosa HHB12029 TaxID=1314781 RepID=A0A165CX14_EXIGL|nr:hypothetical protein EXIGLDRAFT_754450 [Exidia glandulosa HHB12029]